MNIYNNFIKLASLYKENGYNLYLVGGTSRDYLLKKIPIDFDLCSDATPVETRKFLPNADYTFEKFGTISLKIDGKTYEITTLRKENGYIDKRHPNSIDFIRSKENDYFRRDFTINAIYIDSNFKIYDYGSGLIDLNNKLIRIIGDPNIRISEDPLRILRALRFSLYLDFEIEESLALVMKKYSGLLSSLNSSKVKNEISKALKSGINPRNLKKALKQFNIVIKDLTL